MGRMEGAVNQNRNNNREIWEKYKPVIMQDKKEPFQITAAGCTLFRETGQSSSFPKKKIRINKETTDCAIEYAIWYDYDIQHLYELEHVWVYVNHDGSVQKAEASFHGKYLNVEDLLQEMTEAYIKEQFGFRPSMEFVPFQLGDDMLMTWEELEETIPVRVNLQIERIREFFANQRP